jgi:protein O-GlcNAc transferase
MKLTVAVPVYNEQNYILRTLESLAAQDYQDFCVIVSDNASTDETSRICREFALANKRFEYVRLPRNEGAAFNFQHTLRLAHTPYFMWMGGHDLISKNFLSRAAGLLDDDSGAAIGGGLIQNIDEQGGAIESLRRMHMYSSNRWIRYLQSIQRMNCAIVNFVFRRTLLDGVSIPAVAHIDGFLLSHMLWFGNVKYAQDAFYYRRYFREYVSTQEKHKQYMERVAGAAAASKKDYRPVVSLYLEDLPRLITTESWFGKRYQNIVRYMLHSHHHLSSKSRFWYRLFKVAFRTGNPRAGILRCFKRTPA